MPLAQSPPHTIRPYRGPLDTIDTMLQQVRGPRGEQSVYLRTMTEEVVKGLTDKDYLGEILAIRNWVAEHCRFLNDPISVEYVKDPQRIAEEIQARGRTGVDCDEIASLIAAMCAQVGRQSQFVVVGFGRPGHYTHVFTRVKEPKSGDWIVCDPVAGTNEYRMLKRVKTYREFNVN